MIIEFMVVKMGILHPVAFQKHEDIKKPLKHESEGFLYF